MMTRRRRRGLMALILILSVAWIAVSRVSPDAAQAISEKALPLPGHRAPDFTLPSLAGEPVTLSDLQGQVVLVNIWATWCPPCRDEMPAIEAVYQRYGNRGFTVLAVNQMEPQAAVADFVQELGLTFPIVLDGRGSVSQLYRVRALPTTFFIGRDGMIRDMLIGGPMGEAFIESKVVPLLDEGDS
jgi:cytochrome c biogenesis protein CcmG/thiol:disulfide interchange protein DsbE